jgi:hypothetical protein
MPIVNIDQNCNSYLVDFLTHGSLKQLGEDNSVTATDAWLHVSGFLDQMKMLSNAVKKIVPEEKRGNDDGSLKFLVIVPEEKRGNDDGNPKSIIGDNHVIS